MHSHNDLSILFSSSQNGSANAKSTCTNRLSILFSSSLVEKGFVYTLRAYNLSILFSSRQELRKILPNKKGALSFQSSFHRALNYYQNKQLCEKIAFQSSFHRVSMRFIVEYESLEKAAFNPLFIEEFKK